MHHTPELFTRGRKSRSVNADGMGEAMRRLTMGQWRSGAPGGVGQALSLVAVLCLMFAVMLQPMRASAQVADGLLPTVICHAGGDSAPVDDKAPAHHPGCALCPLCVAAALHALGAAPPPLPLPSLISHAAPLPPARAGPAPDAFRPAPRARAPPVSV